MMIGDSQASPVSLGIKDVEDWVLGMQHQPL
jgi:hypothetical protein